MNRRSQSAATTPWREFRPLLLLLVLAVLVPAGCLLWFMSEAVDNERLAVRQRLTDLYQAKVDEQRVLVDAFWQRRLDALSQQYIDEGAGERFARLVEAGIVHGAILFDEMGRVAYPMSAWARLPADARATEMRGGIQTLLRTGLTDEAVESVTGLQADPTLRDAQDAHGRLILPDTQLLVLESLAQAGEDPAPDIFRDLELRLRDYHDLTLPSTQRRFLMAGLQAMDSDLVFPTLDAERLSEAVLQTATLGEMSRDLRPRALGAWWLLPSADGSVIAVYRPETLVREMQTLLNRESALPGVTIRVAPPADPDAKQAFLSESAGPFLPGWDLCLLLEASDPFSAEADRRIGRYLWIGLLTIAVVAVLAALMAGVLFRQIRLTRLKNDFVATVSHELKTPLSSMRVLVDTLLEGRVRDEKQGRQYLQLIARENERLSRLIENFLSFSRMERNKRTFQFTEQAPTDLAGAAADILRERFDAAGGSLEVESAPDLPPILADRDALVTVLLNLLDNAYKYSGDDKRVRLQTSLQDGDICFAVQDHGIGISRRDARKIMDRFYQVDQRLSRKAGGCGLGLSIVSFIVDAHHGRVDIQSRLGEGSTFTVRVPVASVRPTPHRPEEGGPHG